MKGFEAVLQEQANLGSSVNGMSDSFRDERLLGEPDFGEPVARRRFLAHSTIRHSLLFPSLILYTSDSSKSSIFNPIEKFERTDLSRSVQ